MTSQLEKCAFEDCGHLGAQHDEDGVCDVAVYTGVGWTRCGCNVFVSSGCLPEHVSEDVFAKYVKKALDDGFRAGIEAAAKVCEDGSATPYDWGHYYAEVVRALASSPTKEPK